MPVSALSEPYEAPAVAAPPRTVGLGSPLGGDRDARVQLPATPPFDLRGLRTFVAVAREGQITRAAATLGLAQAAVTQSLLHLECRTGVRLLERHARGVSLTPAGDAFLGKAQAVITASQGAVSSVEPWARGESRVAFGFTASAQRLTRPLRRRFAESHPGLELETCCLTARERLAKLRAGSIDVELLYPPPMGSEFITRTLIVSPRYAVLCERHRLASRERLRLAEIASETVPGWQPDAWDEWCEDDWLLSCRGCEPANGIDAPVELDELWTPVYAGTAIAVLPVFMLPAVVGDGVRAIPLLDVPPLEVVLARRRDDRRLIVRELLELCPGPAARAGQSVPHSPALAWRDEPCRGRGLPLQTPTVENAARRR